MKSTRQSLAHPRNYLVRISWVIEFVPRNRLMGFKQKAGPKGWRTLCHLSYVSIIIVTWAAANFWLPDSMSRTLMLKWGKWLIPFWLHFKGEDQRLKPLIWAAAIGMWWCGIQTPVSMSPKMRLFTTQAVSSRISNSRLLCLALPLPGFPANNAASFTALKLQVECGKRVAVMNY